MKDYKVHTFPEIREAVNVAMANLLPIKTNDR